MQFHCTSIYRTHERLFTKIREKNDDNANGEFYVFKAIPTIHEICIKYNIYEEW